MAFTDLHEEIAAAFARLEGQTSGLVADGISLVEVKSFESERERLREYAKTPLGKARRAQYMSSDRGKEVRRNSQKRRLATPEGREAKKKWDAAYHARRRGLDA